MRKYLVFASLIILVVSSLIWYFIIRTESTKFKTTTVAKGDLVKTTTASGKIDSTEVVELSFSSNGKVVWIGPGIGETLTKNQTIARLDNRELQLNLSQKEASLRAAQSDLDKVLDDIRLFRLSNPEIVETQTQKNLREKAESARDAAFFAVEAAKVAIANSSLQTPIAGILVSQSTKVGQNVQAFVPVFKVADFEKTIFLADVDQTDIGNIRVGQSAKVTLDTFPAREIVGKVSKILPDTSTTTTGAVVVKVEIKLDKIDFPIQLGLTGEVTIEIERKEQTLTLPNSAIFEEFGKKFVFTVNRNKIAHKREIQVGTETDEKVEILEGISENEVVIISDLSRVADGKKVELVE